MRFAMIQRDGRVGLAAPVAGGDAFRARFEGDAQFPGTLQSLVIQGEAALRDAARVLADAPLVSLSQVTLLPPLATPPKIVCVGLNYMDHTAESGFQKPDYPTIFARFPSSLIGHGQAIVRPRVSTALDYEGEVAAVIGKGGRHIPRERALEHVMGYSLFNDASIRDYQLRTPQWTVGKNFDGTGAFGPFLVTADELPPGASGLTLTTRVNGQTVQQASTNDLLFDVATLVSMLSEAFTFEPGDVIVTGTPAGVGAARKPPLWLKPGDLCEVEVEGIGLLSNTVVDESSGH